MRHDTRSARCRRTAFDELECVIPFHAGLIAAWKEAIPFRLRSYDPQSKAWRFWGGFDEVAVALLLQYFPAADVPRRPRPSADPARSLLADQFRVLHLRETAPLELIEASYRVMARLNHPDRGGSTEAMQAINGAYMALKARVSA